jgi:hypothetical protein
MLSTVHLSVTNMCRFFLDRRATCIHVRGFECYYTTPLRICQTPLRHISKDRNLDTSVTA